MNLKRMNKYGKVRCKRRRNCKCYRCRRKLTKAEKEAQSKYFSEHGKDLQEFTYRHATTQNIYSDWRLKKKRRP